MDIPKTATAAIHTTTEFAKHFCHTNDFFKLQSQTKASIYAEKIRHIKTLVLQVANKEEQRAIKIIGHIMNLETMYKHISQFAFGAQKISIDAAKEMIEAYNSIPTDGSFRDDVNQFLADHDYKFIDKPEYQDLMEMVNDCEGMEYLVSSKQHDDELYLVENEINKSNIPMDFSDDKTMEELQNYSKEYNIQEYFLEKVESESGFPQHIIDTKKKNIDTHDYKQDEIKFNDAYDFRMTEKIRLEEKLKPKKEFSQRIHARKQALDKLIEDNNTFHYEEILKARGIVSDYKRFAERTKELNVNKELFDQRMNELKTAADAAGVNKELQTLFIYSDKAKVLKNNGNEERAKLFEEKAKQAKETIINKDPTLKTKLDEALVVSNNIRVLKKDVETYDVVQPNGKKLSSYTPEQIKKKATQIEKASEALKNRIKECTGREVENLYVNIVEDVKKEVLKSLKADNKKFISMYETNEYLADEENLNKINQELTENPQKITADQLKERDRNQLYKTIKRKERATELKNKLYSALESHNSEVTGYKLKAEQHLADAANIKNPKIEYGLKAISSIVGHLDDNRTLFHSDSQQFVNAKTDLQNLKSAFEKGEQNKYKDLMEKATTSIQTYINAKTNNGQDMKRSTTMGKLRLNYMQQALKLCNDALETQKVWEGKEVSAKTKIDNSFKPMSKEVFTKKINDTFVSKASKENQKTEQKSISKVKKKSEKRPEREHLKKPKAYGKGGPA